MDLNRSMAIAALAALLAAACGSSSPTVIVVTATPTATATPTTAPTARPNGPPVLGMFVNPSPPKGAAPLTLLANMCHCSDPDADHLYFTLEWGDGVRSFHDSGCRFEHVYAAGSYRATFCVSDHVNPDVCNQYNVTAF